MTHENAGMWPEQNAVMDWWERHQHELKEAVTAERIRQMKRAEAAEAREAEARWEAKQLKDIIDGMLGGIQRTLTILGGGKK